MCDNAWLGNRLTQPNGQTGVLVGLSGQGRVYEAVSFHLPHRFEHASITATPTRDLIHHFVASRTGIKPKTRLLD